MTVDYDPTPVPVKGRNGRTYPPLLDRLAAKIDFNGVGGCWLWTGATVGERGYGQARSNGKPVVAHRAVWEATVGPIAEGMTIDHLCRVRLCVNPDHLEPVTMRENILRGEGPCAVNARKLWCAKGHPLDGENLRIDHRGGRQCRLCERANGRRLMRERRQRIKEGTL